MAAEHLDAVVGDPHRLLGYVLTRHVGLPGRAGVTLLDVAGGLPRHPTHGFDLHVHLGQAECNRLLLGDRLVEGHALLGVGHAELEYASAGSREQSGVRRARVVEDGAYVAALGSAELGISAHFDALELDRHGV